jgi:hypothetical protein
MVVNPLNSSETMFIANIDPHPPEMSLTDNISGFNASSSLLYTKLSYCFWSYVEYSLRKLPLTLEVLWLILSNPKPREANALCILQRYIVQRSKVFFKLQVKMFK